MALAALTVELRTETRLVDAEVTGGPCFACGDTPYLAACELVVLGWMDNRPLGECCRVYLCPSCGDAVNLKAD